MSHITNWQPFDLFENIFLFSSFFSICRRCGSNPWFVPTHCGPILGGICSILFHLLACQEIVEKIIQFCCQDDYNIYRDFSCLANREQRDKWKPINSLGTLKSKLNIHKLLSTYEITHIHHTSLQAKENSFFFHKKQPDICSSQNVQFYFDFKK